MTVRVLALVVAAGACLGAQTLDETLGKLFGQDAWKQKSFPGVHWLDQGATYTTVESDGKEIARYNTVSGKREVLLAKQDLEISASEWTTNLSRVLLFTNTKKVWRDNTRGDYWIVERATGKRRQLGGDAPPASLMFGKLSPDGTRVAYVRENNLYVEDAVTGAITSLTRDGSETLANGTTDWVYEEEFSLRDGFRWSPDGASIAYFQFDTSVVGQYPLVNATDSLYPKIQWIRYPKVGTENSAVRAGVAASGGETRWMRIAGDPKESYLPRMEWAGNSNELVMQQVNRKQNRNRVVLADVRSGRIQPVHEEEDAAWLDVVDEIQWIGKGREFLWTSEKDGWMRVYAISRDGSKRRAITPEHVDVAQVVAVDGEEQWLYYLASPSDATQRHLFRMRLDGSGKAERLSSGRGWHSYQISPNGQFAAETGSNFDAPAVTRLVRLPSQEVLRVLEDNHEYGKSIETLLHGPAEFFRIGIGDGVELDGWMIKPPDFRADRKYPLLVHVYTEPFDLTATDKFTARALFHRALAREGYIVVSMDNRGTPSLKGRAWRKAIYPSIGLLSSQDQAAATRALIASRPYIDGKRVAVWGWSGGGTSTLNLMFRYPELFNVGMAVAPVPDQRLYDTVYQERYMGTAESNPDGYRSGSPIHFAAGLAGKLLVVHGTGDDNVHWQGTQLLVNRLVELDKQFDLMIYPNRTHAISEGKGTSLHLHKMLARYLMEHMPAGR